MDTREKLNLLGQAARYDDCTALGSDAVAEGRGLFAPETGEPQPSRNLFPCISHLTTPWGERKATLKVLQTSACQNNCNYCAFRAGRDLRRAHLTPDELARSFDLMYRAGVVESLFLSSGVIGTVKTMDEMLATTELVRLKYSFRGYIHLKLLPGAEDAHIARAVELADRVSVNLEGPTPERLAALAPQKRMDELVGPLRVAAGMIRQSVGAGFSSFGERDAGDVSQAHGGSSIRYPGKPAPTPPFGHARLGMSTQFVVGPAGESDRELLGTAQMLYREVRLSRAYYSAFNPVKNTPLEGATPTDPLREHRLYQADWLLRFYNFSAEELPFDAAGLLSAELDPKAAWAQAHPERFPIEVNAASVPDLLRVPGIGPHSARAIVQARRQAALRELGDLRKLGARADRAASYVTLAGKRPPYQPPLPFPQ
jgi:predicted DNA-binding helix-hairpin-helix protein